MQLWILIVISLAELFLFFLLLRFFVRLRRSEELLLQVQGDQETLLDKLKANADLEHELVQTFALRQHELKILNEKLQARADEMKTLLEQAESISRSPQFLRELILTGKKKGRTTAQLAKATGLSQDEVELIMAQAEAGK